MKHSACCQYIVQFARTTETVFADVPVSSRAAFLGIRLTAVETMRKATVHFLSCSGNKRLMVSSLFVFIL